MTTLLRARSLVLNMNTSSTLLDEQHRELHDRCQTSMSSVRISDDGSQEVGVGKLCTLSFGRSKALLSLFSVVEKLCHEKVADFVRYSGLRLVSCNSCSPSDLCLHRDNLLDLAQARRLKMLSMRLAIQKRTQYPDTSPFESP